MLNIYASFFQEFVFPNLYSFSVMLVLGILAFFAEVWFGTIFSVFSIVLLSFVDFYFSHNAPVVMDFSTYCARFQVFLARGLQLEKTGKVANVIYMEVRFLFRCHYRSA